MKGLNFLLRLCAHKAGRAFEQAQAAGLNVSVLEQTKRFDRATTG